MPTGFLRRLLRERSADLYSYELEMISALKAKMCPKAAEKLGAQLQCLTFRQRQRKGRSVLFFSDEGDELPEVILFTRGESELPFAEVELVRAVDATQRLTARFDATAGAFFSIEYNVVPSRRGFEEGTEVNITRVDLLADLEPQIENEGSPQPPPEAVLHRIRFPLISASSEGLALFDSEQAIHSHARQLQRAGRLKGLRIFGRDGILYMVEPAKYVPRDDRKATTGIFSRSPVGGDLTISSAHRFTIHEIRRTLNRGLKADRDLLENHPFHYVAMARKIDKAESLDQMWEMLPPFLEARKRGTLPSDLIREVRQEDSDEADEEAE
jgi:hypothetical protein